MYSIAFTGHRPEKLGGYDWSTPHNRRIGLAIKKAVLKEIDSIQETHFEFYFGGALGADQMAFEIVDFIQKKRTDINITKVICIPFKAQPNKWPEKSKQKYYEQIGKAEKVIYVDVEEGYKIPILKEGQYHPSKLMKRNDYLVDHCQTLIAIYNGSERGGTAHCVKYAQSQSKNIVIINPN